MRASNAVGLLLVSSMSIFGIYGRHKTNTALAHGPEPVYVNGQMGVYNPDTGEFVPSTSPDFDATCDLIQQRRAQASGNHNSTGNYGYYHHWYYSPSVHAFSYSSGGMSGVRSSAGSSFSSSSHSIGSVRGGIGSTGHAMGGSHS